MHLALGVSCFKAGNDRLSNEDRFSYSKTSSRVALSDGASNGFESRRWAKILARSYVEWPSLDEASIGNSIKAFNSLFEQDKLNWTAQGAFDRGSFATIVGVAYTPEQHVLNVSALGDSIFVLIVDGKEPEFFPTSNPDDLLKNPVLLSTKPEANQEIFRRTCSVPNREYFVIDPKSTQVLLLTDALAYWLLTDVQSRLPLLYKLQTRIDFFTLIERERSCHYLRNDDTTLLRLTFDEPSIAT